MARGEGRTSKKKTERRGGKRRMEMDNCEGKRGGGSGNRGRER